MIFLRPALTDLFFVAYLTYYFIAIALGVVLWLRSRPVARRFIFMLTVAYLISYAGYFLLPHDLHGNRDYRPLTFRCLAVRVSGMTHTAEPWSKAA